MSNLIEDVDYPSARTLALWPDCAIKGCANKCCKSKNSIYCWPHTKSDNSFAEILAETNQLERMTNEQD